MSTVQIRSGTANLANARLSLRELGFREYIPISLALILRVAAIDQNNRGAIANQRLVLCARAA